MVEKRKKPKFRRQGWNKMSKLGKGRKQKLKWRTPRGRDSKVRLGDRAHPKKVKIGWGSAKKDRKDIFRVESLKDFDGLKVKEIIIGRVGKKKKEELLKKAKEKGLKVMNRYKKVKSGEKEDE